MPCPTNIQPLYIESPSNLQSIYNTPVTWFEVIDDVTFLKLRVQPEEYITLREGEAPKILRSFITPQYPIKRRETGFVITLGEDDIRMRYCLEEISQSTIQPGLTEALPIRVIDYVRPDKEAFKSAITNNTNPYTIRQGFLEVEPGSGTSGVGTSRFATNGIRFSFRQINLVL